MTKTVMWLGTLARQDCQHVTTDKYLSHEQGQSFLLCYMVDLKHYIIEKLVKAWVLKCCQRKDAQRRMLVSLQMDEMVHLFIEKATLNELETLTIQLRLWWESVIERSL